MGASQALGCCARPELPLPLKHAFLLRKKPNSLLGATAARFLADTKSRYFPSQVCKGKMAPSRRLRFLSSSPKRAV